MVRVPQSFSLYWPVDLDFEKAVPKLSFPSKEMHFPLPWVDGDFEKAVPKSSFPSKETHFPLAWVDGASFSLFSLSSLTCIVLRFFGGGKEVAFLAFLCFVAAEEAFVAAEDVAAEDVAAEDVAAEDGGTHLSTKP